MNGVWRRQVSTGRMYGVAFLLALAACSGKAAENEQSAAVPAGMADNSSGNGVDRISTPPSAGGSRPAEVAPLGSATSKQQNNDDPSSFIPLQSNEVKDAIHRALQTGQTQRWQDGKLSGYAVPSQTPGANGCRAVRYTIDQQPGAPYGTITACDAH